MFDGLRNDASDTSGFDDQPVEYFPDDKSAAPAKRSKKSSSSQSKKIFGLTAIQRFILSLMLLISVCLLGAGLLIMTGKFAF